MPAVQSAVPDLELLSGFTLVRNAVQLQIFPSLRALPRCSRSATKSSSTSGGRTTRRGSSWPGSATHASGSSIAMGLEPGDDMLALETQRAMDACRGSWGIYIQATKSSTSGGANILRHKSRVGPGRAGRRMLVDYLHFYGASIAWRRIANGNRRRGPRCIRLGRDIRPYQGAQGFRVERNIEKSGGHVPPALGCFTTVGLDRPHDAEKLELTKRMYPWALQSVWIAS